LVGNGIHNEFPHEAGLVCDQDTNSLHGDAPIRFC
jgi:hypothetical protein